MSEDQLADEVGGVDPGMEIRVIQAKFVCEICSHPEHTQYLFYLHLKHHYEAPDYQVKVEEIDPDIDGMVRLQVKPNLEVIGHMVSTEEVQEEENVQEPNDYSDADYVVEAPPRPAAKKTRGKKAKSVKVAKKRGRPPKKPPDQTGEEPPKKITCEVCNKNFKYRSAMKVHMRIHEGKRPYVCPHCQLTFRQQGDLQRHIQSIHDTHKLYQCEYCGKEFARKYSLTIHRKIHTGDRNYICKVCQKAFRAATYLQDHMRVHTGEKPYSCPRCLRTFRVRCDVNRHMKIHEDKKPPVVNTVAVAAPPPTATVYTTTEAAVAAAAAAGGGSIIRLIKDDNNEAFLVDKDSDENVVIVSTIPADIE